MHGLPAEPEGAVRGQPRKLGVRTHERGFGQRPRCTGSVGDARVAVERGEAHALGGVHAVGAAVVGQHDVVASPERPVVDTVAEQETGVDRHDLVGDLRRRMPSVSASGPITGLSSVVLHSDRVVRSYISLFER